MTESELQAIEARGSAVMPAFAAPHCDARAIVINLFVERTATVDIPALVAEVRRLQRRADAFEAAGWFPDKNRGRFDYDAWVEMMKKAGEI